MVGGVDVARLAHRRQRSALALLDEHAHELLDEQRVALGAGEDVLGQVGGAPASPSRCSTRRAALLAARAGPARAVGRPRRREVGPTSSRSVRRRRRSGSARPLERRPGARSGRGRSARPSGCPRRGSRAAARRQPPRAACGPPRRSRPGGGGLRLAQRARHALDDRLGVLVALQEPASAAALCSGASSSALPARRLDDLAQRPEGEALAVGRQRPADDLRLVAQRSPEVLGQARLADAGRADERDELAAAPATARSKAGAQQLQLALAADERRVEPARRRRPPRPPAAGRRGPARPCP